MEKREEKAKTLTLRTGIFSKGFTILEIIITLFIISLTLGLVLPSINTERPLKAEAKRLSSILRYLLDEAITKKETLTLTVRLPEKRITYEVPEGKKEELFPHLEEIKTSSRGTVKDSNLTIFFYPSGIREHFIFIFKAEKDVWEVEINPVSNRIKLRSIKRGPS